MFCLETRELSHRYPNGDAVLDGIELQVPQASIYGFLGPNGAGKTTTLRLILGLLKKQSGSISIFGQCFEAHRVQTLARVGSLIESPSLYDHLTATENLALLQKVYRTPKARIEEVLALVGLSHAGRKRVSQFSLGMKQRLSIAVALLHRPALLILDEPTNGLDPQGIVEMRDLLTSLNRDDGITIVISSHLLSEIERWVTHLGIIHRGRLKFQGSLNELREAHQAAGSITLATNDDARALRVIADCIEGAGPRDGHIRLPAMSRDRLAGINRRLVEAGVDVHALASTEADLEAIFMSLVAD